MSITVIKDGVLTTLQDLGRYRYARYGINPNGAMDQTAVRLINILLGNDEAEAVLEMHFPAGEMVFEADTAFAIGGADFGAELDGKPVENFCSTFASKKSKLRFAKKRSGSRSYLAVAGGFAAEEWLGSRSTNLTAGIGGPAGRNLKKGDRILFNKPAHDFYTGLRASQSIIPPYSQSPTIRIVEGGEFDLLTALSEQILLSSPFAVTADSNRMGYRLNGEPLHLLHSVEMVSSAVNFGTTQLLPDGQIIILMADHQTSGGYPRIGNVISVDLPLLAQLEVNDRINFQIVSVPEAESLMLEFEKELCFLRIGCKLQANPAYANC